MKLHRGLLPVAIDFESYYDKDYSLSKITPAEYIRSPQFEILGVAIRIGAHPPVWITGDHDRIRRQLRTVPWDRCLAIAHNALFDGAILEWIFGCKPAKYLCTMMGSRPHVVPYTGSMSLADVTKYLGVTAKQTPPDFKGLHRTDLSPDRMAELSSYALADVFGCSEVFEILKGWLVESEQDLLDLTVKKFTRPRLLLDAEVAKQALEDLAAERKQVELSLPAGVKAADIRSRNKFAELLKSYGKTVPLKISATTGQHTWALAKTDADFLQLLTADEPVPSLVKARLALASNQEQSRLARFVSLAETAAELPVPLMYWAAHTGRFGGTHRINLQNLTSKRKGGKIRAAIVAPPGHTIIAADYAQIEARITFCLAGQLDVVAAFARGEDVYSIFASNLYGKTVTKDNPDTETERFVGKTCILGLGFGMGASKFASVMAAAGVPMSDAEASRIVMFYRRSYPHVKNLWYLYENAISVLAKGMTSRKLPGCAFSEARITLPNGMPLIYPNVRYSQDDGWYYDLEGTQVRLWGGILTENIVQALARNVVSEAELRLAKHGLTAVMQVHDELVFCVPDAQVEIAKVLLLREMTRKLEWLPRLPIAVDIKSGRTYAEAK